MALVEVHDAGLDAQRVRARARRRRRAARTGQPHVGVADVQARGDPAVGEVVLRPVGVEQEQRHAADVDPPDLRDDLRSPIGTVIVSGSPSSPVTSAAGRRSGSVSTQYSCCQPDRVDALAEVAVAVHEADGDQRQGQVGGLLEDVAGEHAEAAPQTVPRAHGPRK